MKPSARRSGGAAGPGRARAGRSCAGLASATAARGRRRRPRARRASGGPSGRYQVPTALSAVSRNVAASAGSTGANSPRRDAVLDQAPEARLVGVAARADLVPPRALEVAPLAIEHRRGLGTAGDDADVRDDQRPQPLRRRAALAWRPSRGRRRSRTCSPRARRSPTARPPSSSRGRTGSPPGCRARGRCRARRWRRSRGRGTARTRRPRSGGGGSRPTAGSGANVR